MLAAPGIEAQVHALLDESGEHGEAYHRAKAALLATLERTRLVRDVRSILDRNSIDTDTRDGLFASLFSMYKLVSLIRAMARFVGQSSTEAGASTDELERAAAAMLAEVEGLAGPERDVALRAARKLLRGVRDLKAATRTVSGGGGAAGVVAKQTEHAVLAMYHLTMAHVRAQLVAQATAEAENKNANPTEGARSGKKKHKIT